MPDVNPQVQEMRDLISEYQATARTDNDKLALVDKARLVVFTNKAAREIAVKELAETVKLSQRALDIPPVEQQGQSSGRALSTLDRNNQGQPLPNINNVLTILTDTKARLYWDEFLRRILKEDLTEWNDEDTRKLTADLQSNWGLLNAKTEIVFTAIQTYAERHKKNTVRSYLDGLRWDGIERIAGFMARVFGAPDTEYTRAVSTNFWRSLVVRPLNPGAKVDNMVVLEGEQGRGKSTALREIAGPRLFAETYESPTSKDFFMALEGKLLVEVGEMDSFSRADTTAVKRVLTCQVDRYRPPYGRAPQDFPRQGIFVGTTNRDDWARDPTGGRRFWPIRCERVDLEYIRANREQLFAEAMADVRAGKSWWEVPLEAAEAEQSDRFEADPWEDEIVRILTKELTADALIRTSDLLERLGIFPAKQTDHDRKRVANVMKYRLRYEQKNTRVDGMKTRHWIRKASEPVPPVPPLLAN